MSKATRRPSYLSLEKENYSWKSGIDYRKHPELYRVGKGEQGVLLCEPYKSEIGQHWRFKTEAIAVKSSTIIYDLFLKYLEEHDFVGADMARKYLQMGFTRARRYANYKGGKKYDHQKDYHQLEKGTGEAEKARSAAVFYEKWKLAEQDLRYTKWKVEWIAKHE